jgi:hypothetical protein
MSCYSREQFDLFEVQLYNQYYSYKQFNLFEVQLYNSYYSYKQFNLFEKLLESRRLIFIIKLDNLAWLDQALLNFNRVQFFFKYN